MEVAKVLKIEKCRLIIRKNGISFQEENSKRFICTMFKVEDSASFLQISNLETDQILATLKENILD